MRMAKKKKWIYVRPGAGKELLRGIVILGKLELENAALGADFAENPVIIPLTEQTLGI